MTLSQPCIVVCCLTFSSTQLLLFAGIICMTQGSKWTSNQLMHLDQDPSVDNWLAVGARGQADRALTQDHVWLPILSAGYL